MEQGYWLSEADRDFINELKKWWMATPENDKKRPPPFRQRFQTPEVYVAKVPPSGIPALSQTGTTGTGTTEPLDDVPGYVECQIYALDTTDPAAPTFQHMPDLDRYVYNLSPNAITADETPWVVVQRDKFGEWFVVSPGAGAADIDFEDFQETVNVVTAVVSRECGLLVKNTPFVFNFRLPVGSSVSVTVGSGNTGTGTVDDGNDTVIDFRTSLITLPAFPLSFTFDADTCTGTITATEQQVCVFSGGLECCPDYTGTGTS